MTALIACTGAAAIDWVGTSMGGLIGMLLAAEANTPIRRLVINDVGPFIPGAALQRIGAYIRQSPIFEDLESVEKYLREIYSPFGDLTDENWRHLAYYGARTMANNKLSLAFDPAIAQPFLVTNRDVDLWWAYDRVRCPVLCLHGLDSDVLPASVAQEMTERGPRAELVEFPGIGHAPALMSPTQIAIVAEFLGRA
jgi:pimeloyl-ACP methyl ester carboxylesterase